MKAFLLNLKGTINNMDDSILQKYLTKQVEQPAQSEPDLSEQEVIRWWEVTYPERQRT